MKKNKLIASSLASVAVLGAGFLASHPVNAAEVTPEEAAAQKEFLANYDKALADSKLALCRNSLDQQNEAIKNLSVQVVKKPEIEVKYKYITKPNDSCESKLKYYEGIANEAAKPLK